MRAFLRQPSTPWITFDRDSRVAAGETAVPQAVLAAFRSSIHDGLFAKANANEIPIRDAAVEPPPSSRVEPSGMSVAQDLEEPSVDVDVDVDLGLGDDVVALPRPRGVAKWFAIGIGAMTALAFAALAVHATSDATRATPANRAAAAAVQGPTMPIDTSAREVPPPSPSAVEAAPEPTPAPKAIAKDDPRAKLTRLQIQGDAAKTDVWLDGKRLLGRGARHFDIVCGKHSIAIAKKPDAHEMDLPCAGELILSQR